MDASKEVKSIGTAQADKSPSGVCGIVMPISAIDGCSEGHWADVLEIVSDAIEDAGFEPNLVSNAEDVGIIQKRIIQNLYDNPVVVCDVSGKNPNVMFELGLRLAFDKPTIIIKDDKTSYSFDTSPIEHVEYPRDLRFTKIVEFKIKLQEKIRATFERASRDEAYTTFLSHFGEFKIAKLSKKEVSSQEFILEELRSIKMAMRKLELSSRTRAHTFKSALEKDELDFCAGAHSLEKLEEGMKDILRLPGVTGVQIRRLREGHSHLLVGIEDKCDQEKIKEALLQMFPRKSFRVRHSSKVEPA
jgi:hypothetical protein